jgi:eukaryotic-like serine/threonine-protein kinase
VHGLVLELVDGQTLEDRILASPGGLPLEDVLSIARQIALALEAAHENGIIHRGLKPANVKITPAAVVKVLDFGVAKLRAEDTSAQADEGTLTLSGTRRDNRGKVRRTITK